MFVPADEKNPLKLNILLQAKANSVLCSHLYIPENDNFMNFKVNKINNNKSYSNYDGLPSVAGFAAVVGVVRVMAQPSLHRQRAVIQLVYTCSYEN